MLFGVTFPTRAILQQAEASPELRHKLVHELIQKISVEDLENRDIDKLRRVVDEFSRQGFRSDSAEEPSVDPGHLTTTERLALLDERFGHHDGKSVADHVREFFPQICEAERIENQPSLPTVAPVLWKQGRLEGEDTPSFVRRVYGPWIGRIAKPDIRQLDPKLYGAIFNYCRTSAWPDDLALPTRRERTDARVESLVRALPEQIAGAGDLQRLGSTLASRHRS